MREKLTILIFVLIRKWDMFQRDHVKTLSKKEVDSNEEFDLVASVLRSTGFLFNLAPRSLNGKHKTANGCFS